VAAGPVDTVADNAIPQLSATMVLHARMVCALVATIAMQAPEVLRHDTPCLRAVLLPVLQCTTSSSSAVSMQAHATVDALCGCVTSRVSDT
jgi:hypothetical protein